AVAKWGTVASINQTGTGIRLPNFCNLGVMLRSMIVVNALLVAAAVLHATAFEGAWLEFIAYAAYGEPVLILSLVVLCAARPWLHSMGYVPSIVALLVFELAVAWSVGQVLGNVIPGRRETTAFQATFLVVFA